MVSKNALTVLWGKEGVTGMNVKTFCMNKKIRYQEMILEKLGYYDQAQFIV